MNVLFTGACGVFVRYLAKSITNIQKKNIFLADMNLKKLNKIKDYKTIHILGGKDKNFSKDIVNKIKKNNIKIVLSVVDEELLKLAKLSKKYKFKVIQPKYTFVKMCLDKFKCSDELFKKKINKSKTYLLKNYKNELRLPVILKPRVGRGSRGVFLIKNQKTLNKKLKLIKEKNKYIVQKFFEGDEYTVSVLCNKNNNDFIILPKKIILKKGVTKKAITLKNKNISTICRNIIKKFNPSGPFNVQCIASGNKIEIFEINPRISTSSTLSIAAGLNEPNLMIDLSLNKKIKLKNIKWIEKVKLIRNNKDNFYYL